MDKYQSIVDQYSADMNDLLKDFESNMKMRLEHIRQEAEESGNLSDKDLKQFDKALRDAGLIEMFGLDIDESGLDEVDDLVDWNSENWGDPLNNTMTNGLLATSVARGTLEKEDIEIFDFYEE